MDTDQVLGIIKQVSADIVEPRFRALHEDEIDSRAPGDYVTVADRESRARTVAAVAGRRPRCGGGRRGGSFVDPGQLDAIGVAPHCFVVDPLDGTNNFVRGSEDFAVMVAELRGVETVGAWIYQPRAGRPMWPPGAAGSTAMANGSARHPSTFRPRGPAPSGPGAARRGGANRPGDPRQRLGRDRLPACGHRSHRLRRLPLPQAVGSPARPAHAAGARRRRRAPGRTPLPTGQRQDGDPVMS